MNEDIRRKYQAVPTLMALRRPFRSEETGGTAIISRQDALYASDKKGARSLSCLYDTEQSAFPCRNQAHSFLFEVHWMHEQWTISRRVECSCRQSLVLADLQ